MSTAALPRTARRLMLLPVVSLGIAAASATPASANENEHAAPNGHAYGVVADGPPDFANAPYGAGTGRKVR